MTLSTVLLLATEAAAEEASGLDFVLPAVPELIFGAIAFSLLLALVWGRALPALNKALTARQDAIQGQLTQAEAARTSAEEAKRNFDAQIADSRGTASAIIDEAKVQAEALRTDIMARAQEEADALKARARDDVEAERSRLVSELRTQVATLSVALAGKIVSKELDVEQHRALVDQYIDELSGLR